MRTSRPARALACGLLALLFTPAGRAYAVDGVIEINQARAAKGGVTPGDTPGFPITLSADASSSGPMSFRLTGPLFNNTTENAIEIISPHVTVDLNGFTIACTNPPCAGDGIHSTQSNITVMNGTVRGFEDGVNLSGNGARAENVRALGNNNAGVHLGNDCTVRNSLTAGNATEGILVGNVCIVSGNTANSNMTSGICTGQGSNVFGNIASGNMIYGLNLASMVGYSQNVMSGNGLKGVNSGVSAGLNVCNGTTTCPEP